MHWDKCMIEAPHLLYMRSCTFYLDVFEAGHWQCFPFALWLRHGPYNTLGSIYVWGTLYTTCHGMCCWLRQALATVHSSCVIDALGQMCDWGSSNTICDIMYILSCCVWGETMTVFPICSVIEAWPIQYTGVGMCLRHLIYYMSWHVCCWRGVFEARH